MTACMKWRAPDGRARAGISKFRREVSCVAYLVFLSKGTRLCIAAPMNCHLEIGVGAHVLVAHHIEHLLYCTLHPIYSIGHHAKFHHAGALMLSAPHAHAFPRTSSRFQSFVVQFR